MLRRKIICYPSSTPLGLTAPASQRKTRYRSVKAKCCFRTRRNAGPGAVMKSLHGVLLRRSFRSVHHLQAPANFQEFVSESADASLGPGSHTIIESHCTSQSHGPNTSTKPGGSKLAVRTSIRALTHEAGPTPPTCTRKDSGGLFWPCGWAWNASG